MPKNEMTPEDVRAVLAAYTAGESSDKANARRVPLSEIEGHDWDLTLGRYVTVAAESEVDLSLAVEDFLGGAEALRVATEQLAVRLEEAGLS